mmetsp:Transcript_25962/g.42871  ORF Transcript_25962/g.42871 Transcript_25962/m.42871 type:complete len:256 (-) Transcript_25962:213-980(-)
MTSVGHGYRTTDFKALRFPFYARPKVRLTASDQRASLAWHSFADNIGSNAASGRLRDLRTFVESHTPTARPAANAAPIAVVSTSLGLCTGTWIASACICIRSLLTVMPPSTCSADSLTFESASIASRTSRAWNATDSSAARQMCAFVVYKVMPTMHPRASDRQYGANSPEKAGTNVTPSVFETDPASTSISDADPIKPRLSRSHCTARPAIATDPSSAYITGAFGPSLKQTVDKRPCVLGHTLLPTFMSMKQPVP